MPRVNQHHIARRLNISQITVSRALRGGAVSEETRRRVLEACAEMGYHVNHTAQSLVSGRTRNIIYAVESFTDLSGDITHAQLIGAGELALGQGYKISIDLVDRVPELAASGFMDGALVAVHSPEKHAAFMDWARRTEFPIVLVDWPVDEPGIANAHIDNHQAAMEVTRHLLDLGHRDLIFFGLVNTVICQTRWQGVQDAVLAVPGASVRVFPIDRWVKRPEEVLAWQAQFAALKPLPTAIIASSDSCATGLLFMLTEMGIRVPADVSLAGFDNARWTMCLNPPLTTVDLQGSQVGKMAMQALLRLLAGSRRHSLRTVSAQLIVRASTAVCCLHQTDSPNAPAVAQIKPLNA